ncbi:MAG: fibronectin type III domain-containing protein [Spirochaetales bacterium]|nr:fibronectin type III domain-containing protein [Spirochaetales bacterium]
MKKILFIILMIFSLSTLFSQVEEGTKLFPTRLSVSSTDSTITLKWRASGNGEAGYVIYRYTEAITPENFGEAEKISTLTGDVTTFEDFPQAKDVPYFYAVLALNEYGDESEIFIPFGNINLYGVSVLYVQSADEALVKIDGLTAVEENGTATLKFRAEPEGREILIYRNTAPILNSADLLEAILIDRISSGMGEYIDTPISGVDYYYALIGSRAFKKGEFSFIPGENSTLSPLILPTTDDSIYSVDADFSLRSRPLPYLSSGTVYQNRGISAIIEKKPFVPLENEMQANIDKLLAGLTIPDNPDLEPVILSKDLDENAPGWDPRLSAILSGDFISGNYEKALSLLLSYQKLPANREMEYRIHYYLGQVYFFLEDYENALVEFIFAEENFFIESKPWMDRLFKVSDLIES